MAAPAARAALCTPRLHVPLRPYLARRSLCLCPGLTDARRSLARTCSVSAALPPDSCIAFTAASAAPRTY